MVTPAEVVRVSTAAAVGPSWLMAMLARMSVGSVLVTTSDAYAPLNTLLTCDTGHW